MAMSEQYGIIDDNDVNQNIHRRLKDYGFSRPLQYTSKHIKIYVIYI